eukprot:TRINITY_DN7227_c1_g1_i3.p1 TRINITY_DN7227_c1_g1~~TRINITY_DN7227_c1_g1_i3.p1  ORF type:complete len:154 (+),score=1.92 TRINITY_DN7227_c1_g1_i3:1707-2168(+)
MLLFIMPQAVTYPNTSPARACLTPNFLWFLGFKTLHIELRQGLTYKLKVRTWISPMWGLDKASQCYQSTPLLPLRILLSWTKPHSATKALHSYPCRFSFLGSQGYTWPGLALRDYPKRIGVSRSSGQVFSGQPRMHVLVGAASSLKQRKHLDS